MEYRERGYRYPIRGGEHFDVFRSGTYRREDLSLTRLEDLEGWQIAEGEPDIRGWGIYYRGGDRIGQVESLIASPKTQDVYFLIVQTGGTLGFGGKHVLVPMDYVDLDRDNQCVNLDASRDVLEHAVEWHRDREVDYLNAYRYWQEKVPGYLEERAVAGVAGGEAPPSGESETRIPLREEEIVTERGRERGEVVVERHVETEERTFETPVTHTEVEVERRPVTGEARYRTEGDISESEVRVPVVEEEVHVVKRPVVKEEIVVRQRPETEVERRRETVRREVAEVRREGDVDIETKGDIDVK
ncbi:MAG: DUF2382 domain-containing protein [Armatimonadetes bacterium]|nr:DUF2382 domain-containing protein [Armatimonadota bacterium]